MKRKVLTLLLICFCSAVYSLDDSKFRRIISQKNMNGYNSRWDAEDVEIHPLNETYSIGILDVGYNYIYTYVSDGKNLFDYDIRKSKKTETNIPKYIYHIPDTSCLIGDFSFDENLDYMELSVAFYKGYNGYNHITIRKLDDIEDMWSAGYFKLIFPGLKIVANNTDGGEYYYTGKNPRVQSDFYISLDDVKFCIVNGKRGICVYTIGKVYQDCDAWKTFQEYMMDVKNGDDSSYSFFYWDKNQKCYLLDRSVTQDQLKNASCLKDYFAYNGLKFSKLDSKLTESDLKYLDKSQLRLMRNAVYARHGRTFKSIDLQSLWDCYTWYEKNPNYSDDLLTETDKYNIELVQKFETGK